MKFERRELRVAAGLLSAFLIPFGVIGVISGLDDRQSAQEMITGEVPINDDGTDIATLEHRSNEEMKGGVQLLFMGAVTGLGFVALRPRKIAIESSAPETTAPAA